MGPHGQGLRGTASAGDGDCAGYPGILPDAAGQLQTSGADGVYRRATKKCAGQDSAQRAPRARNRSVFLAIYFSRIRLSAKRSKTKPVRRSASRARAPGRRGKSGGVEIALDAGSLVARLNLRRPYYLSASVAVE